MRPRHKGERDKNNQVGVPYGANTRSRDFIIDSSQWTPQSSLPSPPTIPPSPVLHLALRMRIANHVPCRVPER